MGSQASALSASWRQGSGSECGPSTRWLPLSEGGRPRGQGRVCSRLLWGKMSLRTELQWAEKCLVSGSDPGFNK